MNGGRADCAACGSQTLTVHVGGLLAVLDWPRNDTGAYAVWHTASGGWNASYAPVGETVRPPWFRFREHLCGAPKPDLSEPLRATDAA